MLNYVLAMALGCGQMSALPPDQGMKAIYREPRVYYHYQLGRMRERSRMYREVAYPTGNRTVPVINGYMPTVTEVTHPGVKHITYDYRQRVRYGGEKANFGRMPDDE